MKRDMVREFSEMNGYDEREVNEIVKSLFSAVRNWCCVEFREPRLKYLGEFRYRHSDLIEKHVEMSRGLMEMWGVDYEEVMGRLKASREKREAEKRRRMAIAKERWGEMYSEKRYEATERRVNGKISARMDNERSIRKGLKAKDYERGKEYYNMSTENYKGNGYGNKENKD